MINYLTKIDKAKTYKIDKTKKNILIVGKAKTNNKNKIILNPMTPEYAKQLYGESKLYDAYKTAYDITNDKNIYTVNCQLFTDFIELIDSFVQYNFDFIIPTDIYLRDTFKHPITGKETYFFAYYLERLGLTENKTTLIMTDRQSDLYDSIDDYLLDMEQIYNTLFIKNMDIFNKYGQNLIFVLNNLLNNNLAHVFVGAALSIYDYKKYPVNINVPTYFDIDYIDVSNNSFCFHKHHTASNYTSIEQLNNNKVTNNIYKKVLIDLLIKYVVSQLDLSEFNGTLFNPYVKVQIDTKVKNTLDKMKGVVYSDYLIKQISFKSTGIGVGNIIIDLSITPFSLLETINIMMEV